MKEIKVRKIIMLELILIVMMILIATSYAYFKYETEEDEVNQFKAACYNIEYSEPEGTGVEILNAYPITDEEAKEEKGYKFKVSNKCEENIKYEVILNINKESTTEESLIRISLK